MSSPIRTITQREVSDTLTDWRILVPMFILSFVLPEVLISGANFAVRFVGEPLHVRENLVERRARRERLAVHVFDDLNAGLGQLLDDVSGLRRLAAERLAL